MFHLSNYARSSCPEVLCKKVVRRIFAKVTGKHRFYVQKQSFTDVLQNRFSKISQNSQENTCVRVSLNKVAGRRPTTLLKRRLWHRSFRMNFTKFLRALFFSEHLRWLLLYLKCCYEFLLKTKSGVLWKRCS